LSPFNFKVADEASLAPLRSEPFSNDEGAAMNSVDDTISISPSPSCINVSARSIAAEAAVSRTGDVHVTTKASLGIVDGKTYRFISKTFR
jgi:hypothetical protein